MGYLESRLARLVKRYPLPTVAVNKDEERRELITKRAFEKLTLIELEVLSEALEVCEANPDLPGDHQWRRMSGIQQSMLSRWREVTREATRELESEGVAM
jgi:hypothetical protein